MFPVNLQTLVFSGYTQNIKRIDLTLFTDQITPLFTTFVKIFQKAKMDPAVILYNCRVHFGLLKKS